MRSPSTSRFAPTWLAAAIACATLAGCGNPQSTAPSAQAPTADPPAAAVREAAPPPSAPEEREAAPAPRPRHGTKPSHGSRVASDAGTQAPRNATEAAAPEPTRAPPRVPHQVCSDCGVIESITPVKVEGKGTGLGAVAGGVAGVVVGNQIGGGNGRTVAKILGAAGGALLGNKIEKKVRAEMRYDVVVRMESGAATTVSVQNEPTQKVGDAVKVIDGTIVAR